MSDTFKSAEWQAYMQAELAWTRNPNHKTATMLKQKSDAWAAQYLTPPQRRGLAARVCNKVNPRLAHAGQKAVA